MAINLDPVENQIEDLMVDAVRIERESAGSTATFNSATGTYDAAASTVVYTGKAMISNGRVEERAVEVGGQTRDETPYVVRIPSNDAIGRIVKKDIIHVTTCTRSPQLEGKVLVVQQEVHGTYSVGRKIQAVLQDYQVDA